MNRCEDPKPPWFRLLMGRLTPAHWVRGAIFSQTLDTAGTYEIFLCTASMDESGGDCRRLIETPYRVERILEKRPTQRRTPDARI